jgi:hypothetical protein
MDRIIYTGEIMLYVLCFMIGVMIATAIFGWHFGKMSL